MVMPNHTKRCPHWGLGEGLGCCLWGDLGGRRRHTDTRQFSISGFLLRFLKDSKISEYLENFLGTLKCFYLYDLVSENIRFNSREYPTKIASCWLLTL